MAHFRLNLFGVLGWRKLFVIVGKIAGKVEFKVGRQV